MALKETCTILDCDNAIFVGWRCKGQGSQAKRTAAVDSLGGWEPCLLLDALGNEVGQERLVRQWTSSIETCGLDAVTLGILNSTGSLRGNLRDNLRGNGADSPSVQGGACAEPCAEVYHCDWLHCGAQHGVGAEARIIVSQGIDPLSQGVICAERFDGRAFEQRQREVLLLLMEATEDLHWRVMSGYGLFEKQQSLSPRERDILRELLTTISEKQIAARLGLTVRTTHQYVTCIYRKMNVHSRAELMARFFNAQSGGRSLQQQ